MAVKPSDSRQPAAPKKRASNPNRGSKPGERRGGRPPGQPNKITREVRELLKEVIETNAANVGEWFTRVAAEDPDKALQRYAQLAEFVLPKLARTEVVGDGGGPFQVQAVEWTVVDPDHP